VRCITQGRAHDLGSSLGGGLVDGRARGAFLLARELAGAVLKTQVPEPSHAGGPRAPAAAGEGGHRLLLVRELAFQDRRKQACDLLLFASSNSLLPFRSNGRMS